MESHQLKHSLDPVQTTLIDVQEGTSQQVMILTQNCKSLEADYSQTGAQDGVTCNALEEAPAIPTPRRISMLDHGYSYNPYLDHDEDNAEHYRYDQSAAPWAFSPSLRGTTGFGFIV